MKAPLLALLILAGCSSTGTDYATFRSTYEDRATYGDKFADRPPSLSDEQIDLALEQVCVDGEPNLDAADEIGSSLAGDRWSPSGLGSAIMTAVGTLGC